jgi:hypothetical protein
MKPHDKSAIKRKFKAFLSANVIVSKTSAQPLWFSTPSRDSLYSEDDTVQKEMNRYLSLAKSHIDSHLKEHPLNPNEKDEKAPPTCALKFWKKEFNIPATNGSKGKAHVRDSSHKCCL